MGIQILSWLGRSLKSYLPFNPLMPAAACVVAFGTPLSLFSAENPAVPAGAETTAILAEALGVRFVEGSQSTVVLERDGKQYFIDLETQSITEAPPVLTAGIPATPAPLPASPPPAQAQAATRTDIYEPADDYVYSLPTGRRTARKGLIVNFTHRFAFQPAFNGPGRANVLLGFDDFSISSFGFKYGITDKLTVSAYRSPSVINRPIELMAAYSVMEERSNHPFNASFRVSVDGQDHFRKNFTANIEAVVSRSLSNRGQIYVVPTVSLQNRRLVTKPGAGFTEPPDLPGINSVSIGTGLAIDFRPTLAFIAEVIPTVVNGRELGILRPSYAFGVQKRVRGHAFTLGFSTGPGMIVSQRAGTRATLLNDPSADKPSGLFVGFNLMRRLR